MVPLAALAHADFRKLWLGQIISIGGTQMRVVAVIYHLYQLTRSPLALGSVGLARLLPMLVLVLPAGLVADGFDRRRVMLATQSSMLAASAALAWITWNGWATPWMIYTYLVVQAIASTFELPARQSLIPQLVPREHLPNALSLNMTAWQAASVVGPMLGGLVLARGGVAVVYAVDAVSYLAVLWALWTLQHRAPPPAEGSAPRLADSLEGFRFVRRSPLIMSTMLLDFVVMVFGSATTMMPIFADQVLHVDARGLGLLYAAPAIGAVAAAAFLSLRGTLRRQGPVLLWSLVAYGACTAGFGVSRWLPLSLLLLAGTGVADTVSAVIRGTLRQLLTPDALRGRMTAVNMLFFAGGPQLGEVEAGAAAHLLGPGPSVLYGGLACIATVMVLLVKVPELRRYND